MTAQIAFEGPLLEARGGGHAIAVDDALASSIGLKHMSRVTGTLNGRRFRSSVARVGGSLMLGVHKTNVETLGLSYGDIVKVRMSPDTEPRETDVIPEVLAVALRKNREAGVRWETLSPSVRRASIAAILDAKKEETRDRRVARILEDLLARRPNG
ncbi:MAG: YdeI/OmpD-associated family protein [Actinomycetota bacterium]